MNGGNIVWTFITYAVTAAIVFIVFRLVAEEKIADEKSETQRLLRARQADQAEIGGGVKPRIATTPVRTVGRFPFRLIR